MPKFAFFHYSPPVSRPLGEVVLARAAPAAAPALDRLARAAQRSQGYSPEWLAEWGEEVVVTAEVIHHAVAWTLHVGNEFVGWGAWVAWGRRCRLEHLWIDPPSQRQGWGRLLLSHLAQEARAVGWTALEILSDPTAVPFYRACGAYPDGEIQTAPNRILPRFILSLSVTHPHPRPPGLLPAFLAPPTAL